MYLPVGFGAHHWRIDAGGAPILFATLDTTSDYQSLAGVQHAYATIGALVDSGFRSGVAPLITDFGTRTIQIPEGLLSVTPWLNGRNPTFAETHTPTHVAKLIRLLTDLHASDAPVGIPEWRPRVDRDLVASLRERTALPWESGPFGESARAEIASAMGVIADSMREYFVLAEIAMSRGERWVVTHGEVHWANQFIVGDDIYLIDWDTIALGPPEIDALNLPLSARVALGCDEQMLKMFRLEWQLMEIEEYASWFENQHQGTDDDALAFQKLLKELRPT